MSKSYIINNSQDKIPRKYKRIDRLCSCGGTATIVRIVKNGGEKIRWHCDKCNRYWTKGEVKYMKKIFVT